MCPLVPLPYLFTGYKIKGCGRLYPLAAIDFPQVRAIAKAITFPAFFTPY
jgi:hypothetical protein